MAGHGRSLPGTVAPDRGPARALHAPGRYDEPRDRQEDLDRLIEAFGSDHIFKLVHLPVQSGSDMVLGRMGRRVFSRPISKGSLPHSVKRTGNDADDRHDRGGYYGETDDDFNQSAELIRRYFSRRMRISPAIPRARSPPRFSWKKIFPTRSRRTARAG